MPQSPQPPPHRQPRNQGLYDPGSSTTPAASGSSWTCRAPAPTAIVRDALTGARQPRAPRRGRLGEEHRRRRRPARSRSRTRFLTAVAADAGIGLPRRGRLRRRHGLPAAGQGEPRRLRADSSSASLAEEGLRLLGWRDVPTDPTGLGDSAKASQPVIRQVFVDRPRAARRRPRLRAQALRRPPAGREDGLALVDPATRPTSTSPRSAAGRSSTRGCSTRPSCCTFYPDLRRRACRERHRHGPLALLHQHLPVLEPGPPVPLHLPQRRDQHAARQHQLDARPRVDVPLDALRRRPAQGPAGDRHRRLRLGDVRQRAGAALPVRPLAAPRHDDDGARALEPARVDVRGEEGVLRVPLLPDGAVGRPGLDRLHRRHPRRRHARPQRPAPGPLLRHRRTAWW